jgi:apolipoprotein D and lipocalin family protein
MVIDFDKLHMNKKPQKEANAMITNTMNRFSLILMVVLCAVSFAGCNLSTPPDTVAFVDIQRYVGTWYELARYPQFFERGLVGVTAEYTLQDDGTVSVTNRGFKNTLDGPQSSIHGVATVVDTATNAKLSVKFDPFPASLFPGDYWIIELGDNYEYAVVSNPGRTTLWILSRTPQVQASVYDGIIASLADKGFDTTKLELTPQPAQ